MALYKPKTTNKYETAITVRVRRYNQTYFIVCDEFETIGTLKSRCLDLLNQLRFRMPKQEEDLTVDDLRLNLKKRVSLQLFLKIILQILDNESTCHD